MCDYEELGYNILANVPEEDSFKSTKDTDDDLESLETRVVSAGMVC